MRQCLHITWQCDIFDGCSAVASGAFVHVTKLGLFPMKVLWCELLMKRQAEAVQIRQGAKASCPWRSEGRCAALATAQKGADCNFFFGCTASLWPHDARRNRAFEV